MVLAENVSVGGNLLARSFTHTTRRSLSAQYLRFGRGIQTTSANFQGAQRKDAKTKTLNVDKLNYYTILGLTQNCSQSEIRDAYLKACKLYHPDVKIDGNSKSTSGTEQFQLIRDAYECLSKPSERRIYDTYLVKLTRSSDFARTYPHVHSKRTTDQEWETFNAKYQRFWTETREAHRTRPGDEDKPYYGIKGIPKLPNSAIVAMCAVFILVGSVYHHFQYVYAKEVALEELTKRSNELSMSYQVARQEAVERRAANKTPSEFLRELLE